MVVWVRGASHYHTTALSLPLAIRLLKAVTCILFSHHDHMMFMNMEDKIRTAIKKSNTKKASLAKEHTFVIGSLTKIVKKLTN